MEQNNQQKIPTMREEVNLKVVDAYLSLIERADSGDITMDMLDCSIKALVSAVGWVLTKDVLLMVSEPVTDIPFSVKRYFVNEKGSSTVMVITPSIGKIEMVVNGLLKKTIMSKPDAVWLTAKSLVRALVTGSEKNKNPFKEITYTGGVS